jgi:maltose alpha-D-glucosyltransferase/alpha-amylase
VGIPRDLKNTAMLNDDPLWYKDAIIYEVHVRAFHDLAGDGMGDFRGLTQKLDYLHDLGVTVVWLLPFYPSPLKDDGYDISDYTDIHPDYGTLRDFKEFLNQAHARGIRVITELVLNHTSDQHPWFKRARRSPPGSAWRDFYVWSDSPQKYQEARIIFQDFEPSNWTWDNAARAYYWHRFYSHQPDLNFDNPEVWKAMLPAVDFWLAMGVDGMRLDAVPYLYEREGTTCENLPDTHVFLKALRKHVDEKFPNRMLLAEANQWPEDAVAYFGQAPPLPGDECHMAFNFPVMPRMFMGIHMEDRFPIVDIMSQTPAIPDNCQWGLFLRNHDELTLEMVTDEERDYMYRAYASDPRARVNLGIRRRLAPLLGNNRRRIELMNGLLFSLPGTPVLYYGEEIGMGDNIYLGDRNAVRTPMQWSADRNAGFSRANPQKLYLPVIIDPEYHYEAVNVEAQQNNPNSLLWWMKRLIALRKRHRAFGRGTLEFLQPDNRKILAFLRSYDGEGILVVANLSRFVQYVDLDLSAHAGAVPVELFGRNPFPPITRQPYALTLGPHSFFWFALEQPAVPAVGGLGSEPARLPVLSVEGGWEELFRGAGQAGLEQILPDFLRTRRWFGGKARIIRSATLREAFRVPYAQTSAYLTLIQVEFLEGPAENYVLSLTFASGEQADELVDQTPYLVLARVQGGSHGVLLDALGAPAFSSAVLEAVGRNQSFESASGAEIRTRSFPGFPAVKGVTDGSLKPSLARADQSNTSVVYGSQVFLKAFRRVEEGLNPDLEIGYFLSQKAGFAHIAPVLGAIEYRRGRRLEPMTLAILHGFVPNHGDAWKFTLDQLSSYYEGALAAHATHPPGPAPPAHLIELAAAGPPAKAQEHIGAYLESARMLGQRTAELHLALAGEREDPNFIPEPFTPLYQRSVYQSLRNLCGRVFEQLRRRLDDLPEAARAQARQVLEPAAEVPRRLRAIIGHKISALRTRCHGDYHLGQVLYTGKDFVIIDFEGEPARPLSQRRLKRSPLRDVAGMIRSFHYAAHCSLFGNDKSRGPLPGVIRAEDVSILESWAGFWYTWVSAAFLKAYLETAATGTFLPASRQEFKLLLDTYLLEKAIYELGYELNHRPDWVRIPLQGILQLLEHPA